MKGRFTRVALISFLAFAFVTGFWLSHITGIQPGYFEKAEAPAYGVGGGIEVIGAGMSDEIQEHFRNLYAEEEE